MVGRLLSYWEGNFSGAMLNFQGVFLIDGGDPNHLLYNWDDPPSTQSGSLVPYVSRLDNVP